MEDAVKPAGQDGTEHQEVSPESFIGEWKSICWRQTWERTFLRVLDFCLLNPTPVLLSFHCSGLPSSYSFLTCLVMMPLSRSDRWLFWLFVSVTVSPTRLKYKNLLSKDVPSLWLFYPHVMYSIGMIQKWKWFAQCNKWHLCWKKLKTWDFCLHSHVFKPFFLPCWQVSALWVCGFFFFSLCSAGKGFKTGRTCSNLGSQKCCYQHRADLPGFCKPLSSPTAELGPESKGKGLHLVYQESSNVRFDFEPSLSVLMKSHKHVGPEPANYSFMCPICSQKASVLFFSCTGKLLVLTTWKWRFFCLLPKRSVAQVSKQILCYRLWRTSGLVSLIHDPIRIDRLSLRCSWAWWWPSVRKLCRGCWLRSPPRSCQVLLLSVQLPLVQL